MKIFFLMRHSGYIRNYESILKLLAQNGHHILLGILKLNNMYPEGYINKLISENPNIDYKLYAAYKNVWTPLSDALRKLQDYLRYLTPVYKSSDKLRARVESRIPKPLLSLINAILGNNDNKIWKTINLLRELDSAIPIPNKILEKLNSFNPDLFLISPLVDFGSSQLNWLKAAKSLGIKTALCVASWDNLTNKGLIQIEPDNILVWNKFQELELKQFHKIQQANIIITGAQCYDQWFDKKPSLSKEDFCNRVGLDPSEPYLLYLCSSPFIAPQEVQFVKEWAINIKTNKGSNCNNIGILIRPHPQNAEQWQDVNFNDLTNVIIFPQYGSNPIDTESKNDFYNSIYFSEGVVGINTSAMIEAGILEKPVFTILSDSFKETQGGSIHFHYLVNGGLLNIADDFEQHIVQLNSTLKSDASYKERIKKFISDFIRPHGISSSASEIFVKAIENLNVSSLCKWQKTQPLTFLALRAILFPWVPLIYVIDNFHTLNTKLKPKNNHLLYNIIKIPLSLFLPFLSPAAQKIRNNYYIKNHIVPWLLKNGTKEPFPEHAIIKKSATSNKHVIVGPWISEIGFELLYWIPFLNWLFSTYEIRKDRITVISRGGAKKWYADISNNYIDIFDFFSENEFKEKNKQRIEDTGGQKHVNKSDFDLEIFNKVKKRLNITDCEWIHPSTMYTLFKSYWRREYPISLIEKHTIYKQFKTITQFDFNNNLPQNYIAVKFYFSASFPDNPQNRSFIKQLLETIAAKTNVVLLSTGLNIDDHHDYNITSSGKIHTVNHLMTAYNNLDIQTSIISKAQAFIGTYGGFSYLAPFYGVTSIAFYSNGEKFLPVHLDVMNRATRVLKYGIFDKLSKNKNRDNNGFAAHINNNSNGDFILLDVKQANLLNILNRSILEQKQSAAN